VAKKSVRDHAIAAGKAAAQFVEKPVAGTSIRDHALNAAKFAVSNVPVVGGLLSELIGDYAPTSQRRALEKTFELLTEKLSSLESRIDVETVDKEEFSELFESCVALATRNRREEKLQAAANLMANLLLRPGDPGKAPYEELDHLMRCVDALSIGAVAVLGAARLIGKRNGPSGDFTFPELKNSFSHFDQSFLMSLVSELHGFSFVDVMGGAIALQDFSHVRLRLTPIGMRLVDRFIEGRM
jgi:hypothetical protein